MDRNTVRLLDEAILEALKEVEAAFDMKVSIGSGSYMPGKSYSPKLTIAVKTATGDALTPDLANFQRRHPDLIGKEMHNERLGWMRPHGYHYRRPKFPYTFTQVATGAVYKLPAFTFELMRSRPMRDVKVEDKAA